MPAPFLTLDDVDTALIVRLTPDYGQIQTFEYLEGSITEFPEVLRSHVNGELRDAFGRSLWNKKRGRKQSLDRTYSGQPAKFVLKDDKTMRELTAGRFKLINIGSPRLVESVQVVVVGIPDEDHQAGVRHVIVSLPAKTRDWFDILLTDTPGWTASAWDVWKPESDIYGWKQHLNFDDYYKKVPSNVYRVQGPKLSADEGDLNADGLEDAPASPPSPYTQDIHEQDHATSNQQSSLPTTAVPTTVLPTTALPTTDLSVTRSKVPLRTSPEHSPRSTKSHKEDTEHENPIREQSTSGVLVVPKQSTEPQNSFGRDDVVLNQQIRRANLASASTKRRRLPWNRAPDQLPREKKTRRDDWKHENTTPDKLISRASSTSSERNRRQELHIMSSASTSIGQSRSQEKGIEQQTISEKVQTSVMVSIGPAEETSDSVSKDPENTSPLLAQKDSLHDVDGTNSKLLAVKQEKISDNATTSTQTSCSIDLAQRTDFLSKPANVSARSAPALTQSSAVKNATLSSTVSAITKSSKTGTGKTIDLTDDDNHGMNQRVLNRQISVAFVDEYEKNQHTISFEDCNTAEDMFEEACTWDIADKDTKMLEITIPGLKPARVRKYNEKHFAEKVFEPMKGVISSLSNDQFITLTVRKYI